MAKPEGGGMITLILPLPPSVNAMYANNKGAGKGRYPSPRYKAWKQEAGYALNTQYRSPVSAIERYFLQIGLYPPNRRDRDLDNHVKALQDLLTGRVYADDSQIDLLAVGRMPVVKNGQAVVIIRPVSDPLSQSILAGFEALQQGRAA